MDDKNDEYPHIITSVCRRLLSCQYGINSDAVISPANPCYRALLEQYYIISPQNYLVHKIFLLSKYSQRGGTKLCHRLIQILWTLYSEFWGFLNTPHKTFENEN